MRNKIKFFFSCCLALLLLGSGKAYGQWQNVWGPTNPTPDFTNSCAPNWIYSNTGYCTGLNISGSAGATFYAWSVANGSNNITTFTCNSLTEGQYEERYRWDTNTGALTWYHERRRCNYDSGTGSWGFGNWVAYGTPSDGTVPVPYGNTGSSTNYPTHVHPNPELIDVSATGVYSHFYWGVPTWTHTFYRYNVSGSSGIYTITRALDYTDGPNSVTSSHITATGSVRLTGEVNSTQFSKAGTTTATFTNNATRFFFDQDWNGSFNNVTLPTPGSFGAMTSVGPGQTLGFLRNYTGSTAVTGGILAFGPYCVQRNLNLTSTNSILVDAYNIELNKAPDMNSCVVLGADDVGYMQGTGTTGTFANITNAWINITNSNFECWAVNFCGDIFRPNFANSTDNGGLLINPNVTNFNIGANIVNNSITSSGTPSIAPTLIESKKITVASPYDFYYEATGAPLSILLTHKGDDCVGCSFFNVVSGNFTSLNRGTSTVTITDNYVDDDAGYVRIGGDYTHNATGSTSGAHTVDVNSKIEVTGTTLITGVNDIVSFTSRNSWIKFGTNANNTFTYTGMDVGATGTGLLDILAQGNCDVDSCAGPGGFVWFTGDVTTQNETTGTVSIESENHYVRMDSGFYHTGVAGDMYVKGFTGVDIMGAHALGNGVQITRSGVGADSILSQAGHVDIRRPFIFTQTGAGGSAGYGLNVWANGLCGQLDCDLEWVGGYVWLRNDVTTTNLALGPTTIESTQHYVRIGEQSASSDREGGHFTHNGVYGDLSILAGSLGSLCLPGCTDANIQLLYNITAPDIRRSFVWIGDDVNINMRGLTPPATQEGNAIIRSYGDIVQLDDSVSYSDYYGANLWIDGDMGIRTLGPTALTNLGYDANGGFHPNTNTNTVNYNTDGQGFVTYLSENGFIDFGLPFGVVGVDPQAGGDDPDVIGDNTPFKYTGTATENALLVEGNTRVFFGDSVTIQMGPVGPVGTDAGNAKIFSPNGWIMFADTVGYSGNDGNFITYANGFTTDGIRNRSCWDYLFCDADSAGFVLFDSITSINFAGIGKTLIRSNFDDVIIGDEFTYTNPNNAADNGEFVMQAGQDIYGRNYDQGFADAISINQAGDQSILFEAKNTIHLEQNLFVDRTRAASGDITMKAGYPSFSSRNPLLYEFGETVERQDASKTDDLPSAEMQYLTWSEKPDFCTPYNYTERFACLDGPSRSVTSPGSATGGDIWLEGHALFDLTASVTPSNDIKTTLRAFSSIFIDSTFIYQQNVAEGGEVLLFAEIGNIEAAVTRQDTMDLEANGYIADDYVTFDIQNNDFNKEIRIQAGNQVWGELPTGSLRNENASPTNFATCWKVGCEENAEFNGNILFNKPFLMQNNGYGYTILSAARDIETQVMAPFTFNYNGTNRNLGQALDITAGRHIETHAMMQFNFFDSQDAANITLQAGRLNKSLLAGDSLLCKETEEGTNLTDGTGLYAFNPKVETGGENDLFNNEFAKGGKGNGSILLFDSLEFNYNGNGNILLKALNGNIESDPYLHRHPEKPANPGATPQGNFGDGYLPHTGLTYPDLVAPGNMQHDAQITFNHGGTGVTQLKAIDIKLHDKIAYYAFQPATSLRNGQLYLTAYDSILTRNIEYVNPTDTGSVFITTAKYKSTSVACSGDYCDLGDDCGIHGLPIFQGHIVLGYGADWNMGDDEQNMNDSIVFNFSGNTNTEGANVYIRAGYEGFTQNRDKGTYNSNLFTTPEDRGKGYGGNITFDFMKIDMALGNHEAGGFLEISTPNGNIWGKDSINYHGFDGDIKVDAGAGSTEDRDAIRWEGAANCAGGDENTLNTEIPDICGFPGDWRTGNIMMKGAHLNFADGLGVASFRTREGFIDMYDAFTVDSMRGPLLMFAGTNDYRQTNNRWGDVSVRDFQYNTVRNSGSVFFGADDNIMLNYGYSNDDRNFSDGSIYQGRGSYDVGLKTGNFNALAEAVNPFYSTSYKESIDAYRAIYNVSEDGYLWYFRILDHNAWPRKYHRMYRGCSDSYTLPGSTDCSGLTGFCVTTNNFARPLDFNFNTDAANTGQVVTGGLAVVAANYIDVFTKFTYQGGGGTGMTAVPGMSSLKGEQVAGYGLYMKSQYNTGQKVEKRRLTCEDCGVQNAGFPIGGKSDTDLTTYEWTYIGFHDDARIRTNGQKSLIEAPIVEFFGHAELDAFYDSGARTQLTVKADSLIFHDSAVFSGHNVSLLPYTTGKRRDQDMRYGVVNDRGDEAKFYGAYGRAIMMPDRNTPVIEFGYQRCNEPLSSPHAAPNRYSEGGFEATPMVGGDIIVGFKNDFSLPIQNTVVANHARISFMTEIYGAAFNNGFIDACIRTDLLRIRNKVEFYTDPAQPDYRRGTFMMTSNEQMVSQNSAGMYPHHLHLEPNSEMSIPGEDLLVISTTTVGGYGEIHENVHLEANAVIAPGYSSLMESDCQTGYPQGRLSIHNLYMDKDAVMRISIGTHPENCRWNPDTRINEYCTQTDTLYVQDSVFMNGKVSLYIMPETDYIEPGCYLFMIYNDLNASAEYINNLVLMTPKHGDLFFALDKSERGRVYLCVTDIETPIIRRYIHIHAAEGVTTDPVPEIYHYAFGHDDFTFTATYSNKIPLEVLATGYYSNTTVKLPATYLFDGTYQYTIRQVVQPWDVYFGGIDTSFGEVGNDGILGQRVWSFRNTLFINVDKEDIVSVFNVTGVLFKKLEIPAGLQKMTLERGVYMVTLKDGSVHKIIIN